MEINNQPLYVNGFLWATRMPTLDVLIDRGDFETSQASSIVRSCELDTECIFINELAIAREFQHSQIGRMLKEMLEKHLDKKRLPVFANTIVNSGAYKLFEQMGAMVLSGPGIHNRDGYVLSLKKY